MERFRNLSLKNKILFSTLGVIVLLSLGIALDTRLVLVSGLTSELKTRGVSIAQSIADRGRSFILTGDSPNLVSLVFDAAQLEERRKLVSYIFIADSDQRVLAHTFLQPFPEPLRLANLVPVDRPQHTRLLGISNRQVYDIAVPVWEGIYQIGTVHVGLSKRHIDHLVRKLGFTYFGIIGAIIILFFFISQWLAGYITRPISELTKLADEISRGNLEVHPGLGSQTRCWEVKNCGKLDCPAYENADLPCWYVDETHCAEGPPCGLAEKPGTCFGCDLYRKRVKDEVRQLTDAFLHMTDRLKISQIKIRESEEKYRSLFVGGPNPVFVVDRRTLTILDANPRAEETYGYSLTELKGRPFAELCLVEEQDGLAPLFAAEAEGQCHLAYSRARHYRKGRHPFYVNVYACPARYGKREALIIATTDITEVLEKDAQLIQASKMTTLGEMSAGIAHELNQPLNVIKMGSEYLQMLIQERKEVPQAELSQVAVELSAQVDRAAQIIRRLREFGRKADLSREEVDVNVAVGDVLAIIGRQLQLQDIEIELDLQEGPRLIMAHKNRVEQVLFNLLTNARDALNQRKAVEADSFVARVRIRTRETDDQVRLTVTDNGIGIPGPLREKIFEPFVTTKQSGKGMGLGLSITYGIVKEYEGQIVLASEEGAGATFELVFPRVPAGKRGSGEQPAETRGGSR